MRKTSLLILFGLAASITACVIDDPDISDISESKADIWWCTGNKLSGYLCENEVSVLLWSPEPPPASIIVPGCDAPESDPGRVCDGNGGGGSGSGGGTGGGGGGSGGGSGGGGALCPGGCGPGFHCSTLYGRCVSNQMGEPCEPAGGVPSGQECAIDMGGYCVCSPRRNLSSNVSM